MEHRSLFSVPASGLFRSGGLEEGVSLGFERIFVRRG